MLAALQSPCFGQLRWGLQGSVMLLQRVVSNQNLDTQKFLQFLGRMYRRKSKYEGWGSHVSKYYLSVSKLCPKLRGGSFVSHALLCHLNLV